MGKAQITIHECTDHNWFDRRILGWQWWWSAYIDATGSRLGFARTREKAQAKAEAAARKLAGTDSAPYERYSYEVGE